MVAITIKFLTGRYHATPWGRHVNEGIPEWPPSPWRFLRALVSTWHHRSGQTSKEVFESLLSKLAVPPKFYLPPANHADTQHYVPLQKIKDTTLIFDTFIVTHKNTPVFMTWDNVEVDAAEKDLLNILLQSLTYMGRAESWAEFALAENSPTANCFPCEEGEVPDGFEPVRVLTAIPEPDIVNNLAYETLVERKKGFIEPPGSSWIAYLRKQDAFTITPQQTKTSGHSSFVDTIRFSLSAKPLPQVQDTLIIGELGRHATMAIYGHQNNGDSSPLLSGKDSAGKPLVNHQHAYYLATDENRDGRLDHLTVFAPAGFNRTELNAIANLSYLKLQKEENEIQLIILGYGHSEKLSTKVPFLQKSKTWQSTSPFVLGRHPKFYRTGKPKLTPAGIQVDGPEDQVHREWSLRRELNPNLPKLESVEHLPHCQLKGRAINWLAFRYWRNRRHAGPGLVCGFKLHFSDPVAGPIVLGYGSHYGLGQFEPCQ